MSSTFAITLVVLFSCASAQPAPTSGAPARSPSVQAAGAPPSASIALASADETGAATVEAPCKSLPLHLVVSKNSLLDSPCVVIEDNTTISVDPGVTFLFVATRRVKWGKNVKILTRGRNNLTPGKDGLDATWVSGGSVDNCDEEHDDWQKAVDDCKVRGINCTTAVTVGRHGNNGSQGNPLQLLLANVTFDTDAPAGSIDIRGGDGSACGTSKGKGYRCRCHRSHYWQAPAPPCKGPGTIGADGPMRLSTYGTNSSAARVALIGLVTTSDPAKANVSGRSVSSWRDFLDNEVEPARRAAAEGSFETIALQ